MSDPLLRRNLRWARAKWGQLFGKRDHRFLRTLTEQYQFSIADGDIILLQNGWYVTHTGLIRLARRSRCAGIHTISIPHFCNLQTQCWAFKATVYRTSNCRGFVGYGDANPSNVSPLVRGAEMRVAETRAVNRALRKAYGIGICSVEEIGSVDRFTEQTANSKKVPQPANTHGNGHGNGSVRDRLCQIIRQHQLDPSLVKAYATDFCGVTTLRDATREQVENFVAHLAEWAVKDRNALLCQLNAYLSQKEAGAA